MVQFASKYRSSEVEIMDSFDLQGAEMSELLNDLKTVNRYLGGTRITLEGIKKLLTNRPRDRPVTIVDFGCGDGEMLRKCAIYGENVGCKFKLIGVDANGHILEDARIKSANYKNISFQKIDVFSTEQSLPECDIALCTLFLHHFRDSEIAALLQRIHIRSNVGIVVNDLQRSWLAFRLFKVFGRVFLKSKTARHDGLVSVARGFRKKELMQISKEIGAGHNSVQWCWAFRYQWVLFKNSKENLKNS
ncbi:MAG: methyltransferase [Flavobacteriaceae bacterium]|nr:methyltransferase [Flavobacteriaceae bacterium]